MIDMARNVLLMRRERWSSGLIAEFRVKTPNSQPVAITAGPDKNLWFVEYSGNQIGQITTSLW